MALTTGSDYDHIDISDGTDTIRHNLKDTVARNDLIKAQSSQPSEIGNKIWFPDTTPEGVEVPTYAEFSDLMSQIEVLEPTATSEDVGKALIAKTVSGGKVTEYEFGDAGGSVDPSAIAEAVDDWLDDHPEATTTVQDGSITEAKFAVGALDYVTPEMFGAVGDGETDDSQAVQDACDAGYAVYFASGKTYYLASTVTIDHDSHLFGGENATIKTATPSGGIVNNAIEVVGTLKKTTTLTSDYTTAGETDNSANRLKLSDMTGINIGDLIVVVAEDQYYDPSRQYYYLGATLVVLDVYDGHIYTNITMPWDIENTNQVSVKVYEAPTAIIENLKFISDLDSRGHYKYAVSLQFTKNSIIRNCGFTEWDNDVQVYRSANTLIDDIMMSHSKYDNSLDGDGYGLVVSSSTNTVIQRVIAMSGQHTIVLSGGPPTINTYMRYCEIAAECRMPGFNVHSIGYNTVAEDCVFGGFSAGGLTTINRCRLIKNNKLPGNSHAMTISGTAEPKYNKTRIANSIIEEGLSITLNYPSPQDPISSFDAIIDRVEIENCRGGYLSIQGTPTSNVTSLTINNVIIKNWRECSYIDCYSNSPIKHLEIDDCDFTREDVWINRRGGVFDSSLVEICNRKSDCPMYNRIWGNITANGYTCKLPPNVPIAFSASETGHYVVCGKNIASNDSDDYSVGNVSATVGEVMTRTLQNYGTVSTANDKLVFTKSNDTKSVYVYPKCLAYVGERGTVVMSCKIKNTGNTSASSFKMQIVIVDCDTGKVTYRGYGTTGTATADGVVITHIRSVPANSIVLCDIYCSDAVALSETTFEEFVAEIVPVGLPTGITYEAYNGSNRDGDGTLYSVEGINYIMATPETFSATFAADLAIT